MKARISHVSDVVLPVIFARQDSIGLKSWKSFALDADMPLPDGFATCVDGTNDFPRIDGGLALGEKLGVRGTPTVFVNGWRVAHDKLEAALDSLNRGREPYSDYKKRRLAN